MRFSAALATLAAFASAILALPMEMDKNTTSTSTTETAPNVIVINHCDFPVYVTSVGAAGPVAATAEISAKSTWSELQYYSGTGTAVKITRTADGLWNGASVLVLGYTYTLSSIYYDIGLHAGNPFTGYNVKLSGAGGENFWNPEPQPQLTKGYWGRSDLALDLCL